MVVGAHDRMLWCDAIKLRHNHHARFRRIVLFVFLTFGVVCVRIKYFLKTEYGHFEASGFVQNYVNVVVDDN